MRLGFSTLGCSGEPVERVLELARSTGCSGVELRAAGDEPVDVAIDAAERTRLRHLFRRDGITPIAIASYVRIADRSVDDDAVVTEITDHAQLALDLGAAHLRVFPGGDGAVSIAVETHDSHPRGADVARLLDRVGDPRVEAIWDALHPWRAGEPVAETVAALGDRLAYVQIKDVASAADLTPLPPGHGVLPLASMAAALVEIGYDGWVSLEWESKWYPHARPLDAVLADCDAIRRTFDI